MQDIIIPPYLQPGDTIGITAPAGYVSHERIACAIETFQAWGYKVKIGKTIGTGEHYFSGTDAERLADLQDMLDDSAVKAVVMGRGGYGVSRIIDDIRFEAFATHPKWICGFSDITILHSHIHQNYGIASIHGPMCGAYTPETGGSYYVQSVQQALTGKPISYSFPLSAANTYGVAEGPIVGGNLAILSHLTGSVSQLNTDGKILLIEDIGEHLYHIDRLMLNLKRSGQLKGLKALLVGSFTLVEDTERPFGQTLEEIISSKVREYEYPVAFNFPCGHDTENVSVVLGRKHRLEVTESGSSLRLL